MNFEKNVLIIAYNKMESLEILINRCISIGISNIYIHCDNNPNSPENLDTIQFLKKNYLKDVHLCIPDKHLGAGHGVFNALRWFFVENKKDGFVFDIFGYDLDFSHKP